MTSLRSFIITGVIIVALLAVAGCTQQQPAESCSPAGGGTGCTITSDAAGSKVATSTTPVSKELWQKIRLETSKGNIVVALDPEMPITSGNFKKLVTQGYYDGVIFHRVMDGFMIQGGDPTGTGRGGPGYRIQDEFTSHNQNNRGTLAMANSGANTGGSQFFINLVNNNYLDNKHPVFGEVVEGMDIVDAIGKVRTTGQAGNFRPLENVTIIRAVMV